MGQLLNKDQMKKLQDKVPELVKDNKGALIGAVAGYLLSEHLEDNKKAQSTILGAVVGALFDNSNNDKKGPF